MAYKVSLKKRAIKALEKSMSRIIPILRKSFTALQIILAQKAIKN